MLNNRWLTGSLFLGLIITVSLVSSIPTYTSSVLQKLLMKELEQHQVKNNEFPGSFSFSDSFSDKIVSDPLQALEATEKINEQIIQEAGIPVLTKVQTLYTSPIKMIYEDEARREDSQKPGKIVMMSDIDTHISLIDGRLPSKKSVDGVYEALVPEMALQKRNIVLDTVFIAGEGDNQLRIKPVGTFKAKDMQDPYWTLSPDSFSNDFIIFEELFRNEILTKHESMLGIGRFNTAFDYHTITDSNIPTLLSLERKLKADISEIKKSTIIFNFPIKDILRKYEKKGEQLTVMLWSINVPILIMLSIYLFMVSRLIVQRQLNEIAVLSSRGGTRGQILFIYFIESAILGLIALIVGPFIGLLLCQLLGSSNGFLEFVQRSTLPVKLELKSFIYGSVAVLASILMIMIPVYQASKHSIVNHKQSLARSVMKNQWVTIIFDLALIGIALYGLSTFKRRQKEILLLANENGELVIDPLLFYIPALFIIGTGLLILRIYPLILRLIYKLGEKYWPVSLYSTFLQVSRSAKQYQFLMLFLIMTIGIGVFSASAARTLNTNLEEQLRYRNGAEITLDVRWESNVPTTSASSPSGQSPAPEGDGETAEVFKDVVYIEPPFDPITELKEVEHATKVFKKENVTVMGKGNSHYGVNLMAIDPNDFGQTAWFKDTLLQNHWYEYLNLIAKEPSGILISQSLSSTLGAKVGDYLSINWDGSDKAEFVVYGIINYWPSFNPLEKKEGVSSDSALIVANLPYVQNMMGLEPYDVWVKLKPDISRESFYQNIKESTIPVTRMDDVNPKLVELKNSALLLGINGSLTLGFLISILITFIGFLLYWVLTIKSRTLQYGIYRAMGIPMPQLIGILISEQLLTSGFACLLGIGVGGITSKLFVPLFKITFNPTDLTPPFTVIFDQSDEARIYLFVTFMLIVGLTILVIFLRKIKIHQAIKLGED